MTFNGIRGLGKIENAFPKKESGSTAGSPKPIVEGAKLSVKIEEEKRMPNEADVRKSFEKIFPQERMEKEITDVLLSKRSGSTKRVVAKETLEAIYENLSKTYLQNILDSGEGISDAEELEKIIRGGLAADNGGFYLGETKEDDGIYNLEKKEKDAIDEIIRKIAKEGIDLPRGNENQPAADLPVEQVALAKDPVLNERGTETGEVKKENIGARNSIQRKMDELSVLPEKIKAKISDPVQQAELIRMCDEALKEFQERYKKMKGMKGDRSEEKAAFFGDVTRSIDELTNRIDPEHINVVAGRLVDNFLKSGLERVRNAVLESAKHNDLTLFFVLDSLGRKSGMNIEKLDRNKIQTQVNVANSILSKAWDKKMAELKKQEKVTPVAVEEEQQIVEPTVGDIEAAPVEQEPLTGSENISETHEKNLELAEQFKLAAAKFDESMTMAQFLAEYGKGEIASHENLKEEILQYAELIATDHIDSAPVPVLERFEALSKVVNNMNLPGNEKKYFIVEGETFVVDPEAEKPEEKVEKEKDEMFEAVLETVQEFYEKLKPIFEKEEFKKLRLEYQQSFVEGQIVAFLDELFEEQKDVLDESKKEEYIEDIKKELQI